MGLVHLSISIVWTVFLLGAGGGVGQGGGCGQLHTCWPLAETSKAFRG